MPGPEAEYKGRAGCGPCVHNQREKCLFDRQVHARVGRGLSLGTKAPELISFPGKCGDDSQHRDGFKDNRHRLPLKGANVLEARDNSGTVDADRVVHHRDDCQRQKGKDWIQPDSDEEHAYQHHKALDQWRNADQQVARLIRKPVDLAHQLSSWPRVVIAD